LGGSLGVIVALKKLGDIPPFSHKIDISFPQSYTYFMAAANALGCIVVHLGATW
jgi:hypothetical protein